MAYALLGIMVAVLFSGVVAWFFLRPGGIVEATVAGTDQALSSLQKSFLELKQNTAEMELEVHKLKTMLVETEASVSRRISAFESRYGKQAKETLKQDALEAIRSINAR